jgi:hypothetical protein
MSDFRGDTFRLGTPLSKDVHPSQLPITKLEAVAWSSSSKYRNFPVGMSKNAILSCFMITGTGTLPLAETPHGISNIWCSANLSGPRGSLHSPHRCGACFWTMVQRRTCGVQISSYPGLPLCNQLCSSACVVACSWAAPATCSSHFSLDRFFPSQGRKRGWKTGGLLTTD